VARRIALVSSPVEVQLYFNFRSPYCYLASKLMWRIVEEYDACFVWKPLGGWDGRSPPARAERKIVSTRQDVARFARRLGIPFVPPPVSTDPTAAGAASLLAHERGLLRPYLVEMMRAEWGQGRDIGDVELIGQVGAAIGLDPVALKSAAQDPARLKALQANWAEAERRNVIGVPTYLIDEEIFWGQDRIEFVCAHLHEMRRRRL
jgi:2-hydroxychromene-2-carboxylate isomerase